MKIGDNVKITTENSPFQYRNGIITGIGDNKFCNINDRTFKISVEMWFYSDEFEVIK